MRDRPGWTAPGSPPAALVRFARALRAEGVAVGTGQVVAYTRAAACLDPTDADDLYWAGRACLVNRATDLPAYDRVFRRHMRSAPPLPPRPVAAGRAVQVLADAAVTVRAGRRDGDGAAAGAVASSVEVLRAKDFAELTAEERATVHRLLTELRADPPARRSRRTERAARGHRPDLRGTMRRALRTQGELVQHSWRRRRTRPRRLVLLLDISGSMRQYARALVTFGHALARASGDVEVFCFGTRVTRVTAQLRRRDPDAALAAAAEEVVDWDGGTRIGGCMRAFLRRWGRPGLARGAVVVVCSDGLERGEVAELAAAAERLGRLAHRVVWVNPLMGDPRYQPLARGMAAALPFVDEFVSGHNLASLDDLAALLSRLR